MFQEKYSQTWNKKWNADTKKPHNLHKIYFNVPFLYIWCTIWLCVQGHKSYLLHRRVDIKKQNIVTHHVREPDYSNQIPSLSIRYLYISTNHFSAPDTSYEPIKRTCRNATGTQRSVLRHPSVNRIADDDFQRLFAP